MYVDFYPVCAQFNTFRYVLKTISLFTLVDARGASKEKDYTFEERKEGRAALVTSQAGVTIQVSKAFDYFCHLARDLQNSFDISIFLQYSASTNTPNIPF